MMQSGITLIALVISIIVMLILAGVSINAIIGENGLLTKTQYATFLSEMAAVEEAVGMWKAGEAIEAGGQTTAIPTNGMCKSSDVTSAERLTGEVGYYRVWSMSGTQPVMNILSGASVFNSAYSGELITYPAGVQDLYYLNNEACGIDSKKTYLIDAATGIVYSMAGINLKGVACYSSNMAKAVMNGDTTTPNFAEAEVSGSGSGEKLAGNVQEEYLPDGTKNPNYNPNGFQIIASPHSSNIFKLYNNGDLYGKGVKGTQLNTSVEEMEKINPYVWKEWNVPQEVGEYKKIVIGGGGSIFFIDKNDDLWGYGSNGNNKFGLTEEQLIEYTGREATKIDLNGKKVSRVFSGMNCTFLITIDNHLLAAGKNSNYQLGINDNRIVTNFTEVNIDNIENIEKIYCDESGSNVNIIKYKDNTFYLAGYDDRNILGLGNKTFKTFTKVFDGNNGPDMDQDIKEISWSTSTIILKNDGTLWFSGFTGYLGEGLTSEKIENFTKYDIPQVENFYPVQNAGILAITNNEGRKELYCIGTASTFGSDYASEKRPLKIEIPENVDFKEIYVIKSNMFVLTENGDLYGSGAKSGLGINENSEITNKLIKLNMSKVDTLYDSKVDLGSYNEKAMPLISKDGKLYTTGYSSLMFGNDILQKNWVLVANNVKFFDGSGSYYVDRDNNLWVAGNSKYCGLGERSEEYENIPNYIKNTDVNIVGKVKEVQVSRKNIYVLLNNKELWATGIYSELNSKEKPGWQEEEDKSIFVKILDNVEFFAVDYSGDLSIAPPKIAITSNGDAYGWGASYGGANGVIGNTFYDIPTKYSLPEIIGGLNNIKSLKKMEWQRSCIITKSGKLFYTGKWSNSSYDGGHTPTETFSEYTHNLNLIEGENISSIASIYATNVMFLTNKGRVFGYGIEKNLGIGKTSNKLTETMLISDLNNITQIVAGDGFYVAIDKDGKVYGTGTNTYGTLGRWKGAPRESGRYRTAFEWVECPELEI